MENKFIETHAKGLLKSIEVYFEETSDEQALILEHLDLIKKLGDNKKSAIYIHPIIELIESKDLELVEKIAIEAQVLWNKKYGGD